MEDFKMDYSDSGKSEKERVEEAMDEVRTRFINLYKEVHQVKVSPFNRTAKERLELR